MIRLHRRPHVAASFLTCFGLLALPGWAAALPEAPEFSPCRLEDPSRLASFAAECTTLDVPEDYAKPDGRRIALFIARVPAISGRKAPDPLFLLAGGPGMAATDMYPGVAGAFTRIGRDRDLILVDQRGTGRSNPLHCDSDADDSLDPDPVQLLALTRACLQTLGRRAALEQYTTSVAVRDLEQVRMTLGYPQINLYGVSYGTRVAQHYLRRYPARTRSLILDGVVPPTLALGPDIALDAEAALQRILARCAADQRCAQRFGNPERDYRRLRARLEREPIDVRYADPVSGAPQDVRFTSRHLGVVLRLQSYSSATASLVPLALEQAAEHDNFVMLAALFAMISQGLTDALAVGMHHSVVCTEDVPRIDLGSVDRTRLEATYLGASQLDALIAICGLWPRGVLDPDLHQPLASDVPVLLLSGSDDPVTPPNYAEAAAAQLSVARHLVLDGQGHGQIGVSCMGSVIAAFVRDRKPAELDVSCLQRIRPPPFFLSPAGPAP